MKTKDMDREQCSITKSAFTLKVDFHCRVNDGRTCYLQTDMNLFGLMCINKFKDNV